MCVFSDQFNAHCSEQVSSVLLRLN